ncbi:hypothetical protein NEMIN01_1687 [Nematocida minor]|uniref:uncharacterized protein n=1 Tax=Nematocida minor TaxID=1912983 RepID=UPI002220C58C|nr:uncharacterized protein NEMIN01_1687 [Nematocida minor]KAI5191832.1 hypothetical protein NEMIN01_1687 [Nematocida minor]
MNRAINSNISEKKKNKSEAETAAGKNLKEDRAETVHAVFDGYFPFDSLTSFIIATDMFYMFYVGCSFFYYYFFGSSIRNAETLNFHFVSIVTLLINGVSIFLFSIFGVLNQVFAINYQKRLRQAVHNLFLLTSAYMIVVLFVLICTMYINGAQDRYIFDFIIGKTFVVYNTMFQPFFIYKMVVSIAYYMEGMKLVFGNRRYNQFFLVLIWVCLIISVFSYRTWIYNIFIDIYEYISQ